jgi:hypothetical protein
MPAPLDWAEVESSPWFNALTPSEKSATHLEWRDTVLSEQEDLDDDTKLKLLALSESRAKALAGQPQDADPLKSFYAEREKKNNEISQGYEAFTQGELTDDPEFAALDDTFKGRRDAALVRGSLFVNPSLVLDKDKYEAAVRASDAPMSEKVLALTQFKDRNEQASQNLANTLSYTDEDFRKFASDGYNQGKTNAQVVNEWKAQQKLPDGIFGSILGAGRQAKLGFSGGLAGLERAVGGIGMALGVGGEQYAAESGQEAASYAARREIAGGAPIIGEVAEGATSLIPTLAVGAVGAALSPTPAAPAAVPLTLAAGAAARATLSRALTSLTAGAVTGGLQSAGSTVADAFEMYKMRGDPDADAIGKARVDGAVSGIVTGAVTGLFGALGTKLGAGGGIETLFRRKGAEVLAQAGEKEVKNAFVTATKSILGNATEEAIEEGTDQFIQGLYEAATRSPDKDFQSILEETAHAAKIGGILGGGMQTIKEGLTFKSMVETAKTDPQLGDPTQAAAVAQGLADAKQFEQDANEALEATVNADLGLSQEKRAALIAKRAADQLRTIGTAPLATAAMDNIAGDAENRVKLNADAIRAEVVDAFSRPTLPSAEQMVQGAGQTLAGLPSREQMVQGAGQTLAGLPSREQMVQGAGQTLAGLPDAATMAANAAAQLRAVANNTATPEQVASLTEQGLTRVVDGQPVITDAGLSMLPQDQQPPLSEAERVAEIKAAPPPVAKPKPQTPWKVLSTKGKVKRLKDTANPELESILYAIIRGGGIGRYSAEQKKAQKAEGKFYGDTDSLDTGRLNAFWDKELFNVGSQSTLDTVAQDLHEQGYFPGMAADEVTPQVLLDRIEEAIAIYEQANRNDGLTDAEARDQENENLSEQQAIAFEEATKKQEGKIEVSVVDLQVGDKMLVDGEEVTVSGLNYDEDGYTTSVQLRSGTRFGTQSVYVGDNSENTLFVDEITRAPEEPMSDFLEGQDVDEEAPPDIRAEDLPPIPAGHVRLTHSTSTQVVGKILESGRFNFKDVIDTTTDSFSSNEDVANRLNTSESGAFSRAKFGDKVILMDVTFEEYRKLRTFSKDNPGFVPASSIAAIYDLQTKQISAPQIESATEGELFAAEPTKSTRPKVRGETDKAQVPQEDLLGEMAKAKADSEAERAQTKIDLEQEQPATPPPTDELVPEQRDEPPAAEPEAAAAAEPAAAAEEKPAAPAEKVAPATKAQQAKAERAKRRAALEADLAADIKKLQGEIGLRTFNSPSLDPRAFATLLGIATKVTKIGVITFEDFAATIKDLMPQLWAQIKDALVGVWSMLSMSNPDLEELPSRAKVTQILEALEAEEDADADAEVDTEEAAPTTAPKDEPAQDTGKTKSEDEAAAEGAADTFIPPSEGQGPPKEADLLQNVGFGKHQYTGVRDATLRDPQFMFGALFDDTAMAQTLAGKNAQRLRDVRNVVSRMNGYREYQRVMNMSPEEVAAENTKLAGELDQTVADLRGNDFFVDVRPDGLISIRLKPEQKEKYEDIIRSNSIPWSNQLAAFVSGRSSTIIAFGRDVSDRLAGRPVAYERAASQTEARITADKLKAELNQADDESILTADDIGKYVSRGTQKRLYVGVDRGIPVEIYNEQVYDAAMIGKAHAEKKPMFLLASQPGAGKTFVLGAAIERMKRQGAKKIIYVTRNKQLIKQVKDDLSAYDIEGMEFMTYAALDNVEKNPAEDTDVIIFDEAHEVRYSVSGKPSSRALKAGEWMNKSKFTILSSATPYEDLEQTRFLWATGAYDPFAREDLRGTAERGWYGYAEVLGAEVTLKDGEPSGVKFPEDEGKLKAMRLASREYLRKRGMFTQRATRLPVEMMDVNFSSVKAEKSWVDLFNLTEESLDSIKKKDKNLLAFVRNMQKRILEASKRDAAVELARKKVGEGKRTVIFVETRSEKERDLDEIMEAYNAWVDAGRDMDDWPKIIPKVPGVTDFFAKLIEGGINKIKFESAQDYFNAALGDLGVSFYTGNEAGAQGETSLSKWKSGESTVLVATMARGGTGLSLHDTSEGGVAPRAQIVLNLPWRASEVEQVAGRTARYGMTSISQSYWLFTPDITFDRDLAQRVGNRMASMNALVQGDITASATAVSSYNIQTIKDVNTVTEDEFLNDNQYLNAEQANAVAQGTVLDMAAVETEEDAVYRKVVEDNKITQKTSMAAWEGKEKNRATVALLRTMLINAGLKPDANLVAWDDDGNVIAPSVRAQAEKGVMMSMAPTQDAEYLAAVEAGDNGSDNLIQLLRDAPESERKTVVDAWVQRNPKAATELQRMVDEAARRAGVENPGITSRKKTIADLDAEEQAMWDRFGSTRVSGEDFRSGDRMQAIINEDMVRQSIFGSERYNEIQSARNSLYAAIKKLKNKPFSLPAVTYDDAGNVIPLSQRFRSTSPDIRQSAPSLSPVYGLVKRKLTLKDKLHVKEAFRILRKAIPQIDSLVVVDSLENLLKRTDLTQKEKDTLKGPNFAQGIFSNGRAFVAYNNVVRTDLHASEAAAIAGVMVHELMHKGSAIMRLSPDLAPVYANWKSMLDEYVSNADIERLVNMGYPGYANWRNNTALRESAQEEVFVKRIEALFHKGNLLEDAEKSLMQKFLSLIKALVNKLLGNNMSKSDEVVARWARFFVVATANRHMNMNGRVEIGVMASYIGQNAQMSQFMRDSLDTAKSMAAAGKSSEEIRAVTGWFPGPYDGKMRWEIPDNKASFVGIDDYGKRTTKAYGGPAFSQITLSSISERIKSGKFVKLSEVFQHDDLFAAYPEAANIPFFPIAGNIVQGSYRVIGGNSVITATVTTDSDGNISAESASTILHELQHFIQYKEGFASGGSPDNLITKADIVDAAKFRDAYQGIRRYKAEIANLVTAIEQERAKKSFVGFGGPNQKTIKSIEDSIAKIQESINSVWDYQKKNLNIDRDSTRASLLSALNVVDSKLGGAWVLNKRNEGLNMLYRLLAGEIEARDVQARQNLTPEQRKATAPYSSENIAPEDAIVVFGGGGVMASMAPGESPRDGDVPRPASLFSTYLTPEEAAAVKAAAARMDAGRAEGEEDPLAKFAREQVLGQAGVGMIYKQQQLAPQQAYAMGYIGFAEDSSGLPIVNPAATKKAKSIALELLNPKSFFAMRYQEEAGNFDAAAAVLQLELTRYAIAMLAKGDASLLSVVKRNWNNIIMGKYLTMAAAGRLLQARSHYTGVVAQTLDEMTAEQNKTALKLLKEQKAKDPIRTLQDMENAVANALPDYSALWNTLGKGVPDPKGKPDLNWLEKAMGALDSNTMQMFGQVMSEMGRLSRMVDARSKMKDDDIRRSLPDWGAAPEGEELPTDPDELDRLIAQTREKIARDLESLVAAMGDKPLPPEIKKTLEDNAPKAKRKPAPAKPPVAADAPGVIPPAKQKEINDAIDEVESLREEGDNKATLAAIDKLERLIADLANVPSPTFPSESIKAEIRRIVAEYIRNANNMAYSDFRDSMAADLEDKIPETIREEIQDKLIQATWQTFDRAANKTAEAMLAKMKSVEDIKYGKPDKAVQVRKEVRAAIINRDGLTELVLVKRLTDALVALTVEKDVAAELAQEAYGQSVRYAAKKLALRTAKITESLTSGGNKRMLAAMAKASPDMVSDPTWQHNAVRSVFEASGLTFAEAEVAATNTTSRFAEIFANSGVRIERNAQTRMQDAVVRLIDRYAALQSDTPDLKAAAEIRKRNINDLFRQQVRIPIDFDDVKDVAGFETLAMAMGATKQQAMILFYEAETENRYSKQRGTDRLVLTKLIEFIKEMSPAQLNDPTARDTAVEAFLKSNGFTPEQIREVKPNVLSKLDEYLGEARQAALTRILKQNEAYKKLLETRDGTFLTQDRRELKATLEKIRLGIADTTSSVAQLLAASDEDNPTKFLKTDMVTLAQLDNRITAGEKDGRTHDVSLAVRELFELLARRRAIEPASLDRLASAYNNSALSGVATLGINLYGPVGSMLTRVGMDLMPAAARGNWDVISLVFSSLTDTFSMAYSEGALSIRGDAYTNAMQRVILKVNNLRQGAEKSLEILKNKKAKPWERTKALVDVIQSYTDITRRILSAADQTWFATMEGYFYKLEASKALLKNKIPLPVVQKAIFDITETTRLRITNDKMMIGRYAVRVEELRGKTEKEFRAGINAIVFDESYLDDGSIDLTDEVRKYRTTLDNELRSIIRAAALPYKSRPDQAVDMVLKELNLQNLAVDLRQRDLVKRDIRSFLEEGVKGFDGEEYAGVGKEEALRIEDFARRESEYETGNHKGEKGSQIDIFNQVSMLIQGAGYSVMQKNPLLGRMLLGYFGVPVNLLNRSLWFTPYGLLRYAVAKRIDGIGMPNSEFYQQSMKTTQDMKQRLSEAILGTSVFAFAIALQALGDDDEEELFNVTLAGPTNKTEYDAWVKNGHRKGAIEMNIDGKVYSLNWARGLLEPWKPAMVALGAFDDMKLNRKLGDRENVVPIVDYLAAAASGFGQQASFFGAKTTIGSTFSVTPDTNMLGTAVYKVSPFIPFSGLLNSISKFYTGPNTYRGREGAIWANIPIVSMFATNRAVNALGDPVGVTGDPIAVANDRAWYAGMPLNVGGKMSGNDAKVYEFILERGTGPGIPQRSAIETKNGFITDAEFLDYVAFRGRIVKSQMIRDLPKLRAMDDDSLSKAMGEISTKATTDAKKRFRYE